MARRQRPFTTSIGRALRTLRIERGISQATASERMAGQDVDISSSTISRIERGHNDMTMGVVIAFARVYGVDILDVMAAAEATEAEPVNR